MPTLDFDRVRQEEEQTRINDTFRANNIASLARGEAPGSQTWSQHKRQQHQGPDHLTRVWQAGGQEQQLRRPNENAMIAPRLQGVDL